MSVRKVSGAELLGGRARVVFAGSPLFAQIKKYHENKAARQRDPDEEPAPAPPPD